MPVSSEAPAARPGPDARRSPLRRDAAANLERLIAAAAEVFNEHGTDAGVDRIAERAQVGVGTLYRRFPTKEALIAYVVDEFRAGILDAASAALSVPDGKGLETFIRDAAARLAAHRGCSRQLWTSRQDPSARRILHRRLGRLVAQAREAGTVSPSVTEQDAVRVIWSLQGVIENAGPDAAVACARHLDIVFAGLRSAPTRS